MLLIINVKLAGRLRNCLKENMSGMLFFQVKYLQIKTKTAALHNITWARIKEVYLFPEKDSK